jgi:hypothetical protein
MGEMRLPFIHCVYSDLLYTGPLYDRFDCFFPIKI